MKSPRKVALEAGAKRYFTGRPCLRGHVAERHVTSKSCVICMRMRSQEWYKSNTARAKAGDATWFKANRARKAISSAAWNKAHSEIGAARTAKRRAAKLQRTPPWSDSTAIQAFYEGCPAGHHVDHEIPLQGELISGLHVLENLQYLPATENMSKGNRFDMAAPELL